MSDATSLAGSPGPDLAVDPRQWVPSLPDGAVSVEAEESVLVLRASQKLQDRFEELLAKRKDGALSAKENQVYEAICELDVRLSGLNRLLRGAGKN